MSCAGLQSAIYHDGIAGDVYVSHDEGKSWAIVKDIPSGEAATVIELPFNHQYVSGGCPCTSQT